MKPEQMMSRQIRKYPRQQLHANNKTKFLFFSTLFFYKLAAEFNVFNVTRGFNDYYCLEGLNFTHISRSHKLTHNGELLMLMLALNKRSMRRAAHRESVKHITRERFRRSKNASSRSGPYYRHEYSQI